MSESTIAIAIYLGVLSVLLAAIGYCRVKWPPKEDLDALTAVIVAIAWPVMLMFVVLAALPFGCYLLGKKIGSGPASGKEGE